MIFPTKKKRRPNPAPRCAAPTRGTNLNSLPPRRRSHEVVPSLKMAILLPYPNIFDSDGRPCRQQPALILPPTSFSMHRRIRVPEPYDLTLRIWIALLSPLYTIRDSSLLVLECEQAEAAAAGVPTPFTSSPTSKHWWPGNEKDGQVTTGGVVCCELVNCCLRRPFYIYI